MSRRIARPRREPLTAIEFALRGLRWVAVVLIAAWAFDSWHSIAPRDRALAAAAPAALLAANAASAMMARHAADPAAIGRLVAAQLGLDTVAVCIAVIAIRPAAVSPLWAALALPVLEGAVRYQLAGAVLAWSALALALFGDRIARWEPGSGYGPLVELATHLGTAFALGLAAGYLAEKLVAELRHVACERSDAERRARLLAVLAATGERLSGERLSDGDAVLVSDLALEATIELGFDAAEVVVLRCWEGSGGVVSRLGEASEPLDAAELVVACAGAPPRSVLFHGRTRRVGILGHRLGTTMVLAASSACADPERDEAFGALVGLVSTALSTASRERAVRANERRLRHAATHDPLTGLLNRAGLIDLARRAGVEVDARTRLVAFIDLDGFKGVNDAHGHDVGDIVLRAVALRLQRAIAGAAVGRLGGDEFVLVTAAQPGIDTAGLIEVIGRVFDLPVPTPAGLIPIAGSVGVSSFDPTVEPGAQWRRADEAMYLDKAARRLHREGNVRAAGGETTVGPGGHGRPS